MRAIVVGVRSFRASENEERAIVRRKLTPLRSHYDTLDRRPFGRAPMKDKTVAILECRARAHIASLVRKYGGTPFLAQALAEIPDVDPTHIEELIRDWNSMPPDIFIFQTGVGTRALFSATDSLRLTSVLLRILDRAQVIVRGPKPAMVLRSPKGGASIAPPATLSRRTRCLPNCMRPR
jgi:Uroporphyrinogen-III synthase HemD